MRMITLKYKNRCRTCGTVLNVGDRAYSERDDRINKWVFECKSCNDKRMTRIDSDTKVDIKVGDILTTEDFYMKTMAYIEKKFAKDKESPVAETIPIPPPMPPKTAFELIVENARWRF